MAEPQAAPEPDIIYVKDRHICCDGGGGALGHPKVWYTLGADDRVQCGYCDRLFVYNPDKADAA
ncbi:MAG: zinc-finger domain-containing protein [Pseudomonadota bacterium]